MTFGLSAVLLIIAVILFIVSIFPQVPYPNVLTGLGLAFLAGGHLAGS